MREFLVPRILVKEIVQKKYYKESFFHVKVQIHQRVELKKNSRNSIFTAEEEVAKSINDFFSLNTLTI